MPAPGATAALGPRALALHGQASSGEDAHSGAAQRASARSRLRGGRARGRRVVVVVARACAVQLPPEASALSRERRQVVSSRGRRAWALVGAPREETRKIALHGALAVCSKWKCRTSQVCGGGEPAVVVARPPTPQPPQRRQRQPARPRLRPGRCPLLLLERAPESKQKWRPHPPEHSDPIRGAPDA